ncbi:MAG: hypothetical protein ORN49_03340, partial [Rhodobacteraceae bacterium]|nr:hypothetical protein [Paracoccaceae bacterium]
MMKNNAKVLWMFLGTVLLVLGGLPFLKGGFYIGTHEGDTLHLADILFREAQGQWPHLDFMTPIGLLATEPMALFVRLGLGMGYAIFAGQLLVALVFLPMIVSVICSRIEGWAGWLYGAFVIVLCVALVHGEGDGALSVSMHYNRWAWAAAYLIVPVILIAPQEGERPVPDGLILGLCMAALALTKVTYFISLAPAVLMALLVRRWWRVMVVAALAGLAVAAVGTWLAGMEFWPAYVGDLLTVARSEVRPQPGETLAMVVGGPERLGGSIILLLAVIFLRQSGRMNEGLVLFYL